MLKNTSLKNIVALIMWCSLISGCGENPKEKEYIDNSIKQFLEYNEIASVTPRLSISNILTKMTEVKLNMQKQEYSKYCRNEVDTIIKSMENIQNAYKSFIADEFVDSYNVKDAEQILKSFLHVHSCYAMKQTILLMDELQNKEISDIDTIVKYINNGADATIETDIGYTPLMAVSKYGNNPDIIDMLINLGSNINRKMEIINMDALQLASLYNNNDDIVKRLVSYGANVNSKNSDGATPLVLACMKNSNPKIIETLVEKGANIKERFNGRNMLEIACISNESANVVRHLLKYEKDMPKSENLLLLASKESSSPEVIETLIQSGYNVNEKEKNRTALSNACAYTKNKQIIQTLIENGADVYFNDNDAYFSATLNDTLSYKEIKEILDTAKKEKDLEQRNIEGKPAFIDTWINSGNKNVKIIEDDIAKGKNINAVDADDWTPLMYLSNNAKDTKALKILIDKGSNINAVDIDGMSALMLACATSENKNVVELLLNNGADVTIKDKYGHTAHDYAKRNKKIPYQEIEKILNTPKKAHDDNIK